MEVLQAIFLGIIQGLTEFLPVSSTGHLLLAEWMLGLSPDKFGLSFDAALHLGTLAALLAVFWRDFLALAAGLWSAITGRSSLRAPSASMAVALIIGTIPAVVAGIMLENTIEATFRSPMLVAGMLFAFSGVLLWVERAGERTRTADTVTWRDALLIGCAQAVALVPGVSRSGITIAAGMALGLRREESARFTFLLSAPIIAGAAGKQLFDIVRIGNPASLLPLAAGVLASGIVGYMVIRFLMRFLTTNSLDIFAAYRIVLAAVVAFMFVAGWGS